MHIQKKVKVEPIPSKDTKVITHEKNKIKRTIKREQSEDSDDKDDKDD